MKWVAAFAVCAVGWACGKGGPTSPPVPIPTSLSVAGSREPLLVGMSRIFLAQSVFNDGTSRVVSATWSSSDQNVASVDGSGLVNGRSNGTVRITAAYQGIFDAVELRVAPNYAGRWR